MQLDATMRTSVVRAFVFACFTGSRVITPSGYAWYKNGDDSEFIVPEIVFRGMANSGYTDYYISTADETLRFRELQESMSSLRLV